MNYSGQIELTKMKCVILEKQGKSGIIRGVFIPIKENHLDEFQEGRVAIPISVVKHDEKDKYGNDGFFGQKADSKKYKAATEEQKEEFKKLPILGNFRSFESQGDTQPAQTMKEEDDFPF